MRRSQALAADVVALDARDSVLASAGRNWSADRERALVARRPRHRGTSSAHVDTRGHLISQALGVAGVVRGQVVVATQDPLHATHRLLLSHAVSLISIELESPLRSSPWNGDCGLRPCARSWAGLSART
jgi:PucR family transcriptional regulator, purine catabolism regulatory protein